jgi:hypothetical protein
LGIIISCNKDDAVLKGIGPVPDGDYYVSPEGSDLNPGTFDQPWLTFNRAVEMANPGDIVYFRGGIYTIKKRLYISADEKFGRSGTATAPISYYNYPGEVPIFDYSTLPPNGKYNTGILILNTEHLKFRGFVIRNIYQVSEGVAAAGFSASGAANLTYENITIHNVSGQAFVYYGGKHTVPQYQVLGWPYDSTYFINCDSYNNCDSLKINAGSLGGIADGFKTDNYPGSYLLFKGCRAWNNSDDGFDTSGSGYTEFESCWAFKNGYLDGGGEGIKYGFNRVDAGNEINEEVKNCLSSFNRAYGFHSNNNYYFIAKANVFNNITYANLVGFVFSKNGFLGAMKDIVYRNNISYKNTSSDWGSSYLTYLESNNTWDGNSGYPGFTTATDVTVTDADFVSIIPTVLSGPRKDDGSLPDVNFFKLATGSDLIGAGINVGMSEKPDIGIDWAYLKNKH